MTKFKCNLTLEDATDIQFTNLAGANTGKIESDGDNLVLSNAVGDILLGDGASDIYIGDGTNSVDVLFEVSGSLSAESGAALTLGGAGGTLSLASPTITGTITDSTNSLAFLAGAQTFTGQKFFDAGFDAHPIMLSGSQNFDNIDRSGFYNLYNTSSGSTNAPPGGTYGTMIAIGNDKGGSGFGMQLFHQRTGGAGQLQVRGMNDSGSAWTSWNTVYTASDTAAVANNASTIATGDQIYDFVIGLGYLPKAGGTMTGDLTIDKATPRLDFMSNESGTDVGGRIELSENGNLWVNAQGGKDLWLNWYSPNTQSSKADLAVGDGNSGSAILFVDGSARKVGINDTTPSEALDVTGNILSSGTITGTTLTGTSLDINGNADISGDITGVDNITATSIIQGDTLKLTSDATDTTRHRMSVYDEGATSYGMMLWNTNGTSGDWSTMIYGPNQSSRRISFGKANANFVNNANHAGVDEKAYIDLATGNFYADGSLTGTSLDINGAADISGALTGVDAITMNGALSGTTTIVASGKIQGAELEGTSLDINGNADISGSLQLANTKNLQFIGASGDHARIVYTQGDGTTGDVWSHSFYQNSNYQAGIDFYATDESTANGNIRFKSGQATALTLDSSRNATFAGTIGSGAITSTGAVQASSYKISGVTVLQGSGDVTIGSGGATGTISLTTHTSTPLKIENDDSITISSNVTAGSNSLTAGSLDINGNADMSGVLNFSKTNVDAESSENFFRIK